MKNKLKYIYLSILATLIFVFTFTLVNTKTYAYTINNGELNWNWQRQTFTTSNSKINNIDIEIEVDDYNGETFPIYLYDTNIKIVDTYTENNIYDIALDLTSIPNVTYNGNDNELYIDYNNNTYLINLIYIETDIESNIALNYTNQNETYTYKIYHLYNNINLNIFNGDIKINDSYNLSNLISKKSINNNKEFYLTYRDSNVWTTNGKSKFTIPLLNGETTNVYSNTPYDEGLYYLGQVYCEVSTNTINNLINNMIEDNWYSETKYNDYVDTHSYTNEQYQTLLNNYNSLQQQYTNLQTQYDTLNNNYTQLQSDYTQLQTTYNNYIESHSHTNQEYQNLQGQIDYLLGRIQTLQDSLNQLKARTSLSYLLNGGTIKLVDTISGTLYTETIQINGNQTTFTYNDLSQNFKDAIDNNIQSMVTYDLYITLNNATNASFITEMNDPYRNHNFIGLTYEEQTWNTKIYQPIEDNDYIMVNPMGFVYNEITLNTFDNNNRYFNIGLNVDNYYYQNGYTNGYDTGYANGLENGDIAQYNDGYTEGYEEGYTKGADSSNSLYNMVIAIADTPISIFKQIFNFDVLGINLVQIITMIISLLIIIWLIKKLI